MRRVLLGLFFCTGLLSWTVQTGCSHRGQSNQGAAPMPPQPHLSQEGGASGPTAAVSKSSGLPARLPNSPYAQASSSPAAGLSQVAHVTQPDVAATQSPPPSVHPSATRDIGYRWLVGTLETGRVPNTWFLRYADESDPYGGRVALVPPQMLTIFQAGQLVRIEGQLIKPRDREWVSSFRVETISSWQDSSPTAPQSPGAGSQTGQLASGKPGPAPAQPSKTKWFNFFGGNQ